MNLPRASRSLWFPLARALHLRPRQSATPRIGAVQMGDLRRLDPVSKRFGYDRGQPVDRYYIEDFLSRNAADIQGRVLEIGDNTYTTRFGGARVRQSDVLHVRADLPQVTIVGDITHADHIPSDTFDCIIFTQTLHLIYDLRAALSTLYRILKAGGVLLATFPGISQIDYGEWGGQWCWAFTALSAGRLFQDTFPGEARVETHGNVLVATAFLHGLASSELTRAELDYCDLHYQLLITARVVKTIPAHP